MPNAQVQQNTDSRLELFPCDPRSVENLLEPRIAAERRKKMGMLCEERVRKEPAPHGGIGDAVSATIAMRRKARCPFERALNSATRSAHIVRP